MKTILVATDFSSCAFNAAKYAADMAKTVGADLILIHIDPVPVSFTEFPVDIDFEEMEKSAEIGITEDKVRLSDYAGDKLIITSKVIVGNFYQELKSLCESIEPYAVVMGSQGTTAAERLIFGGHTVYAMKHLMWPLITVPSGARFSNIQKIGLACDFGGVVDLIPIDEIKRLVFEFKAQLNILNTGKKEIFDPEIVYQSGLLQEMLIDLHPVYHFITNDNTDAGIMEFAEKNEIDLLIVLPKRHDLLELLVHKSHTKNLVLHCQVPVMSLHN